MGGGGIGGGGGKRRMCGRGATPQTKTENTRCLTWRCRGAVRMRARHDDNNENDRMSSSSETKTFEVVYNNPPDQHSLGMHAAPKNTCCGETVSVNNEVYVVSRVVIRYRLKAGRYRQHGSQLDVRSPSRYVVDTYFNSLLRKKRDTDTEV